MVIGAPLPLAELTSLSTRNGVMVLVPPGKNGRATGRVLLLPEGIKVNRSQFVGGYLRARGSMMKRLSRLAKDPDEERVHAARTAIRKFEARVNLLPKGVRKGTKMRRLRKSLDNAMKSTAEVRDLDIIRGKVSRAASPATGMLLIEIDKERRDLIDDAIAAVISAQESGVPPLKEGDVKSTKLQRRFEKVVSGLMAEINDLMSVVIVDAAASKELHKLRIRCKKLRYTLEVASKAGSSIALKRAEHLHDTLGAIRDWDITTSYLGGLGSPAAAELISSGLKERDRQFRAFTKWVERAGR